MASSSATQFVRQSALPLHALWEEAKSRRIPLSFDLEITARCNNDCRHCYINVPAGDSDALARELSLAEIERVADEAAELGALWCLVTGGEPLLRDDFADVYLALKRRGLLVSVFTNACLVTPRHVELFRRYPPRDVEVTLYGATRETYQRVTRRAGSFKAFRRGLALLEEGGVTPRLKAMALRSNVHELARMGDFCRAHTKDYYRFDPLLNLRYDRDATRNAEIRAERLSGDEIVAIEAADDERLSALREACERMVAAGAGGVQDDLLIRCGAGMYSFAVGPDGLFRLCSALRHPDTAYDLRAGTLREAWQRHVPRVRDLRGSAREFGRWCGSCPHVNLCLWCPAHAFLETGSLERHVDGFCAVAHTRAAALRGGESSAERVDAVERGGGTRQATNPSP
jgi:radical SAM protein with 4Fe4S-binding SPASM domain